jgi:glycosyltransferase involved in cell wall biosynthesis
MRVLWISNNPLPEFLSEITGNPALGGSWIIALAHEMIKESDIELAVVTSVPGGKYQKLQKGRLTQYVIPINKKKNAVINDLYPELTRHYQRVEQDFSPDVIHIHGTERYFGLLSARKHLRAPAIISVQGIIASYYKYLLGGISETQIKNKRSLKNLLSQGGIVNQRALYKSYIPIEKEILKNNTYWFCRTTWDRSQVLRYNSGSIIFQGEELLRKSFYKTLWSLGKIREHSIFISSGTIPIKGFHVLLKAAAILKTDYPNLTINVPLDSQRFSNQSILTSNDYELLLNDLMEKNDLKKHIRFLGKLDEQQMANTMASSHVFVLPSFNENSPNSLGEAMMVGTPCVVSPVGGVPDIVQNNESALYAPSGDAAMLAYQIKQIFDNDALAIQLSENGKAIAARRHDIPSTITQYKNAYQTIVSRKSKLIGKTEQVHEISL